MIEMFEFANRTEEEKKYTRYAIIYAFLKDNLKENDYYRRHPEMI